MSDVNALTGAKPDYRGPKMRVLGYGRGSTSEQEITIDLQKEKVASYCATYNLHLVEMIVDPGESAKTLDRPGLTRALDLLRDGQASGMVIFKLDRLTRSVKDLGHLLDEYFGELSKLRKVLYSVEDKFDTQSAAGRLILNVLMSVSQWEREVIVERTVSALAHKRSRSERISGHIPYGYFLDGDKKTLGVNVEEALIVDTMITLRNAGRSFGWIAAHLNTSGVPTRTGGLWYPSTVHEIIARKPAPRAPHAPHQIEEANQVPPA